MVKIGIIVGSTRPGRKAETVAKWVAEHAVKRTDAQFEVIDIAAFNLPLLDEPVPASMGQYSKEHTKRWAEAIAACDGFVFVTPEYNHGPSGALKNAIDFIYAEWNNKAAGFVSYGSAGGVRAVEHLRGIMVELQIAGVRQAVSMSLYTDWEEWTTFRPHPRHLESLDAMFAQLVTWSEALKGVRSAAVRQAG